MNDDDERHAQSIRLDRYHNTLFPRTSTPQSSLPDDADTQTQHWPANMVWKKRIRHFTWTFFTITMATGGIANVLHTGSDLCSSESSSSQTRLIFSDASAFPF